MGSQIDHAAQRWNDGEPLFDMKLIQRTIEDWKRPLPESYFDEPLVLVGPSGVGKGRLVRALLGDYSKFFRKIITHTTRRPRPTELDGVNYHFVTADMFREMVSSDSFLEWASVHDNYYGTSKSAWQENRLQKKISIMEIDVQGANSIRRLAPAMGIRPKFLFVKPPDTGMLRERLERRGAESAEEIALRLRNAEAELQAVDSADYFDAIIVNDDIEEASRALFRLMRDWYPALPSAARLRMLQRKMRRIKKMNQEGESDKAPVGHGNISAEVREIPQINSSSDSDAPKLS
jgi:guanylate kinase